MAEDPNRDFLPVRDGSGIETYRSMIDPRERHIVCKLDRYELEDRYLKLLNDAQNLKKMYNYQEDKIKKLATKLIRVSSTAKPYGPIESCDNASRVAFLEFENTRLKENINVLKNQLLSHRIGVRSTSRGRRPATGLQSGLTTCRSDSGRAKSATHATIDRRDEEMESQNYLSKIESMETEKKTMESRIAELEKELSSQIVANQKGKIVENVEIIKISRQMRQLQEKFSSAQEANESLHQQIDYFKKVIDEMSNENKDLTVALVSEQRRINEMENQLLKMKDHELELNERDERIKDLANEIEILKQHNKELVDLTSKYGQIELENIELRKMHAEQLQNQQSIKNAFSVEKETIAGLRAANDQLLTKIHDLQSNIDVLTVKLAGFKYNTRIEEIASSSQTPIRQSPYHSDSQIPVKEDTSMREFEVSRRVEVERPRRDSACQKVYVKEQAVNTDRGNRLVDSSMQTENLSAKTSERGTSTVSPKKGECDKKLLPRHSDNNSDAITKNTLSREKMLELLDQVQINTSSEAVRMSRHNSRRTSSPLMDYGKKHRQVTSIERLLFGDSDS